MSTSHKKSSSHILIVFSLLIFINAGCQTTNSSNVIQVAPSEITYTSKIEDGGTGPYTAEVIGDSSLATHTIFRPKDMSAFEENNKLPIIAWGNGGCANSSSGYQNFLSEITSYGFLVIAISPVEMDTQASRNTNSQQLLDAVDWAIAKNSEKGGEYYQKIDTTKIAVIDQSCGGLQAMEVSSDPRVSTTVICNSGVLNKAPPAGITVPNVPKEQLQNLHSPILYLLGGESDVAYPNGKDDFSRIHHVPVFLVSMEVGHMGTYRQPHDGEFAEVAVAWFKWQLTIDKEAGEMFTGQPCGLAQKTGWEVEKKNIQEFN